MIDQEHERQDGEEKRKRTVNEGGCEYRFGIPKADASVFAAAEYDVKRLRETSNVA